MTCLLCGAPGETLLDFGPQPVSHRFLDRPGPEYTHRLAVGQCSRCGLAQLDGPAPEAELAPRYDWVRYVEPEAHLDAAARVLAALPGLGSGPAAGASYKDESLLDRLGKLGVRRARAGEAPRLLVARHIVEHPQDPRRFLDSLRARLAPDGWFVAEVPDSERGFSSGDVTTVWEEHTLYFTAATLRSALEACGWAVERLERYPLTMEDVLLACARPAAPRAPRAVEEPHLRRLSSALPGLRRRWADTIAAARGSRTAVVLGAGHRSCAFVNLLGLSGGVDFFVDDDPNKRGRLMPGCQKPIRGGEALAEAGVCLLATNPDADAAIACRHAAFTAAGGRFVSIYPGSKLAPAAPGAAA